jgi:holo-[acyl-carrier protein] synthase
VTRGKARAAVVLLDVARVERLRDRFGRRFLDRIFTPEERRACEGRRNEGERLACRLAAKQAARRILPRRPPAWRALGVRTDASGAPTLEGEALEDGRLLLSLSHDGGVAAAAVVMEEPEP